jgi:hypothetical protein
MAKLYVALSLNEVIEAKGKDKLSVQGHNDAV